MRAAGGPGLRRADRSHTSAASPATAHAWASREATQPQRIARKCLAGCMASADRDSGLLTSPAAPPAAHATDAPPAAAPPSAANSNAAQAHERAHDSADRIAPPDQDRGASGEPWPLLLEPLSPGWCTASREELDRNVIQSRTHGTAELRSIGLSSQPALVSGGALAPRGPLAVEDAPVSESRINLGHARTSPVRGSTHVQTSPVQMPSTP